VQNVNLAVLKYLKPESGAVEIRKVEVTAKIHSNEAALDEIWSFVGFRIQGAKLHRVWFLALSEPYWFLIHKKTIPLRLEHTYNGISLEVKMYAKHHLSNSVLSRRHYSASYYYSAAPTLRVFSSLLAWFL